MTITGDELLRSFDLLPEPEKPLVASEIMRRAFAPTTDLDDTQLAAVYAEFSEADSKLSEEGIEDYEKALQAEDASEEWKR